MLVYLFTFFRSEVILFLEPLLKTFPLLLGAIVDHYSAVFPLPSSESECSEEPEPTQAVKSPSNEAGVPPPVKTATKSKAQRTEESVSSKQVKPSFSLLPDILQDTPATCPYCHMPKSVGRSRASIDEGEASPAEES